MTKILWTLRATIGEPVPSKQSIEQSWELDEGDKIVLEMELHDFNSLCAFDAVLRPEAA